MTEDVQGRQQKHKRLWQALAVLVVLLVVVIVPPLVSLSHYKSQITRLMAASLGRPVRLSSVEFRLLPRPAFVLSDLTVQEDPAFGSEPGAPRQLGFGFDPATLAVARKVGNRNREPGRSQFEPGAHAGGPLESGQPVPCARSPGRGPAGAVATLYRGHQLPHQHQERRGKTAVFAGRDEILLLAGKTRRMGASGCVANLPART